MNVQKQRENAYQVACAVGALDEFCSVFFQTGMFTKQEEHLLLKMQERAEAYAYGYIAAAYGQKDEVKQ